MSILPTQTLEDVWASDDDDTLNTNESKESRILTMTNRDWNRIENNIEKDGYRQGLESTQEDALQDGFNAAFMQSFQMSVAAGKLQGEICARLQDSSMSSSVRSGEALAVHSSEQDQILNHTNMRVSSLISDIPTQLQQKSSKEKKIGKSIDLCDSVPAKTNTGKERVEEKETDSMCNSDVSFLNNNGDFWNELEKHRSKVYSAFKS